MSSSFSCTLPFKRFSWVVAFCEMYSATLFQLCCYLSLCSGETQQFTHCTKIQCFLTLGIMADRKALQLYFCEGTQHGCYFKTNLERTLGKSTCETKYFTFLLYFITKETRLIKTWAYTIFTETKSKHIIIYLLHYPVCHVATFQCLNDVF